MLQQSYKAKFHIAIVLNLMQSLHSVHRSFYVFGGELNLIATLQYITYVRSFLMSDCRRLQ